MIEIISGTNRPGCNTLKIARALEEMYRSKCADVGVLDLKELPQEIFLPESYKTKPESFDPWQRRILAADGIHVVVPEYNGSFPGVLKYFIDMLKFPESFEHRCVAYTGLSAGQWGNLRGVEQLQLVFNYRNAYNMPYRYWIDKVHTKLNPDGTIASEDVLAHLDKQANKFLAFVAVHKDDAAKG